MVELQNDNVGLPTVDARMFPEIVDDQLADLSAPFPDLANQARLLSLMVLPIVLRVRFSEAVTAPGLALLLSAPHRRKRLKWLCLTALRARSHGRERADRSTPTEEDVAAVPRYYF
jgi:hypothetical protein